MHLLIRGGKKFTKEEANRGREKDVRKMVEIYRRTALVCMAEYVLCHLSTSIGKNFDYLDRESM